MHVGEGSNWNYQMYIGARPIRNYRVEALNRVPLFTAALLR